MKARTASRVAWIAWALTLTLGAFAFLLPVTREIHHASQLIVIGAFVAFLLAFATVGALLVSRRPANPIGWIVSAAGLCYALAGFSGAYLEYSLQLSGEGLPGAPLLGAVSAGLYGVGAGLAASLLLLFFPDGRLPSRRWRPVAWVAGGGIALLALGITIKPGRLEGVIDSRVLPPENPLGIPGAAKVSELLGTLGLLLLLVGVVGAISSLVVRFRRSKSERRQQLKWLVYAAVVVALGVAISAFIEPLLGQNETAIELTNALVTASLSAVPIAIGIAVLKYRLYDIDVVINKTVVFGALAAFITAVYVAIVVGIGTLIGSGNEPNLGLSILATAIVAVAFQPVRERVQHLANRLVYGKRATPYEVLSEFSDRVAETYASQEVLPKMAQAIKDGTGAEHAEVWLRSHDELRPAAIAPQDSPSRSHPVALTNGQLPTFDGADKAIEVRHQGELLGALTLTKPQGEPLTPAEDKLLQDLASQAGLVLRNVGLTAELLARLEELKASRQRLVAAQDEERRRLERDLHDGAQQHLVALKTRLAWAKRMTERDANKAAELLSKLEADADEALETLRDLARGIYPPLLADQGLKTALEAHARKLSIPVEVKADDISRYSQEIEAAVYFCCLEALQNVSKYANAARAVVRLSEQDGAVTFIVEDDGRGFDPQTTPHGSGTQNMSDRLEALGGNLAIDSVPGRGTRVTGRVPTRALELAR